MSKKLQCEECGKTEYGEDLYNYDGKILCRYCIVARVCEGITPCEYVGTCNDKTYLNKADQIAKLEQIIKKGNQKLEEYYNQKVDELDEDYNKDLEERVGEILNLEKQLEEEKKLHSLAKSFYDEKQAEFDKLLYDYNQLKKQLAEKDKEIEELKLKLDIRAMSLQNINTERIESERNQTQLAIQELEKVKEWLEPEYFDYGQINYLTRIIDQQIKELKGVNKDGKEN